MAKKRRSRKRAQQVRRQKSANTTPEPAAVQPPRKPAKLRAKIRLRAAAGAQPPAQNATLPPPREVREPSLPDVQPVNRLAGLSSRKPLQGLELDSDLFPETAASKQTATLPTSRAGLGSRLPVFQPMVHRDPEPTWEDTAEMSANVSHPRGRLLVVGLSLALLTTVVAGVAMLPTVRPPLPTDTLANAIPQTSEAPSDLLENLERLLRADTLEEQRHFVTSPKSLETLSGKPPWLAEASLTSLPSRYDASKGELTVWVNNQFPVSVFVHDDLFDWSSLIGSGEQSLTQFFKERPEHEVELRVMASKVSSQSGLWHLPREDYARVRLSDLEGLVKGIAYVRHEDFPAFGSVSLDERKRLTVRAVYVQGNDSDISVPLLTTWVADDWKTRSTSR